MSGTSLAARQVRYEQLAFWRNPEAAVFSFALPVVLLVVFALINSGDTVEARGDIEFMTFLVPGILAFGVINTTYQYLAVGTAQIRDMGVLKRVRGTPLPAWSYLAGKVGSAMVASTIMVGAILAMGWLGYDVTPRGATVPSLVVTLVLGALCFSVLGLAITGIIPNAEAAPPIAIGIILPLIFVSGIFFPIETGPGWLEAFTKLLPVQHFANGLQVAFDPRTTGAGFNVADLVALGAWAVLGAAIALKTFRWDNG